MIVLDNRRESVSIDWQRNFELPRQFHGWNPPLIAGDPVDDVLRAIRARDEHPLGVVVGNDWENDLVILPQLRDAGDNPLRNIDGWNAILIVFGSFVFNCLIIQMISDISRVPSLQTYILYMCFWGIFFSSTATPNQRERKLEALWACSLVLTGIVLSSSSMVSNLSCPYWPDSSFGDCERSSDRVIVGFMNSLISVYNLIARGINFCSGYSS